MQNGLVKKDDVYGYREEEYISPEQCDYNIGVLTVMGTRHAR